MWWRPGGGKPSEGSKTWRSTRPNTSNLAYGATQVTEKDIWIVTYPRSGTTWTQEMVRWPFLGQSLKHLYTQIWQILNGLDFEGGSKIDIDKKFFFLDMDWLAPKGVTDNITACEEALGISIHTPKPLFQEKQACKKSVNQPIISWNMKLCQFREWWVFELTGHQSFRD